MGSDGGGGSRSVRSDCAFLSPRPGPWARVRPGPPLCCPLPPQQRRQRPSDLKSLLLSHHPKQLRKLISLPPILLFSFPMNKQTVVCLIGFCPRLRYLSWARRAFTLPWLLSGCAGPTDLQALEAKSDLCRCLGFHPPGLLKLFIVVSRPHLLVQL